MTIRGTNGYFGRAAFTAYLKDLPPEQVVGERGMGYSCPLTQFLKHIEPRAIWADAAVSAISYHLPRPEGNDRRLYATPKWAQLFIYEIDGNKRGPNGHQVTAAEALAALQQ